MKASDEFVDYLVENIPASKLADFHASEGARRRVWALVEKERESVLLPEERLELEDFMKLEHLLVLAKAKAQLRRVGQ